MKLARIVIAVFIVLVATACTASTGQQKDSASVQDGSELKQVVLEVSTIT